MSERKRPNGTGCIYARKRKDGSIRGYWIKFYVNGDQRVRNAHTTDKDEAERQLAVLLGQKAEDKPIARHQLTLEGAVDNVKAAKAADGKPVNYAYEKYLEPFFGKRTKMTAVTTPRIRQYITYRQAAGASNATVNRELEALSFAFTLAIRDGVLHFKPHMPMLEENNVRTGFFERREFEAVRSGLRLDYLQDVATFGYLTGWRLGEVLGLRWRNVDFEAGEIRLDVGTTKNGEGRIFPMSDDPELDQLMNRRWTALKPAKPKKRVLAFARADEHADEFVFTKKNGKPIGSFRKRWWKACRAAGIKDRVVMKNGAEERHPGRIFHDFRRTAVRNLVNAGVPERVAMEITGHKTRSIFDRYHIVSAGDIREAVRKRAAAAR
jgi:integrase